MAKDVISSNLVSCVSVSQAARPVARTAVVVRAEAVNRRSLLGFVAGQFSRICASVSTVALHQLTTPVAIVE